MFDKFGEMSSYKEINTLAENLFNEAEILKAIKKGLPAQKASPDGTAEFFKINDRKLNALLKATSSDMQKAENAVLRRANDQYRRLTERPALLR